MKEYIENHVFLKKYFNPFLIQTFNNKMKHYVKNYVAECIILIIIPRKSNNMICKYYFKRISFTWIFYPIKDKIMKIK